MVKSRIKFNILCATLLGALSALAVDGQNLVSNGSFETYSALPTGFAQLCKATGWTSTSGACTLAPGCGHPDFMHTAGGAGVQAPNTTFGTTMPHTGNAMIGFTPWYLVGVTNFREYPRITLSAPLVPGQSYTVSFWTTNGTNPYSGWGINNLGVAFTMAPVSQSCGAPITGVVPQLEIPTIVHSTTWQLRSFTFTPAQPFQYMTIGNFHNDAGTTAAQMSPTGGMGAYYFLDDVSVTANVLLPIELLSFIASCQGDAALLEWSTASESGNDLFTIERSLDGEHWEAIGTVPGAGYSLETIHYSFRDPDPSALLMYYRLRQTDLDGAFTFSPVVVREPCAAATLKQRWLIDARGRICDERLPTGGSMAPGVYLVRSEFTDGHAETKKVVVLGQ